MRTLADVHEYSGLHVTIMGLGSYGGGVAAARFFADSGAHVTITDLRDPSKLSASLTALADVAIRQTFWGDHPQDAFRKCDVLVVNPAVMPRNTIVEDCRQRGVIVTTELGVFLHHNRGRVIAVTGTNGKSTTTSLIRQLLLPMQQYERCQIFVGGNIGGSLLPSLSEIEPVDIVVLEISSFQLHHLQHVKFAPEVAVLTNFTPNHLDWHLATDHYHASKQVLFSHQSRDQLAILPSDEETLDGLDFRIRGRCLRFGIEDSGEDGVFVDDGLLILRSTNTEEAFRLTIPRSLPGAHSALNVAAAACAAWAVGTTPESFPSALAEFSALPHRLQLVAQGRNVRFYDDSASTTPQSSIAALRTLSGPIVVLAGGSDKRADLTSFCDELHSRATAVILMGETSTTMLTYLKAVGDDSGPTTVVASDFPDAFAQAVALAPAGGIVLLSPGCASFGWFRDYRDRGRQFAEASQQWTSNTSYSTPQQLGDTFS